MFSLSTFAQFTHLIPFRALFVFNKKHQTHNYEDFHRSKIDENISFKIFYFCILINFDCFLSVFISKTIFISKIHFCHFKNSKNNSLIRIFNDRNGCNWTCWIFYFSTQIHSSASLTCTQHMRIGNNRANKKKFVSLSQKISKITPIVYLLPFHRKAYTTLLRKRQSFR